MDADAAAKETRGDDPSIVQDDQFVSAQQVREVYEKKVFLGRLWNERDGGGGMRRDDREAFGRFGVAGRS